MGEKMRAFEADAIFLLPTDIKEWFLKQLTKPAASSASSSQNLAKKVAVGGIEKGLTPKISKCLEDHLAVSLKETQTVWLLTIVSSFYDGITSHCIPTQNQNEVPRPNGKSLSAESQTPKSSEKAKASETFDVKITNSFVNASAWDLYDTYAQVAGEEGLGIKEFQLLIDTTLKSRGVIQSQPGAGSEFTRMPAEKQMRRLMELSSFNYSILAIERLLASKTYENKQSLLTKPCHYKYATVGKSLYSYLITLLWTYDNHFEKSLGVTSFDWNCKNPLLLAVGYGQLNYSSDEEGCVCIWSPKNPSHPEKKLLLNQSVTTLCFSADRPNVLAVATRSGQVLLIDVANTANVIKLFPRDNEAPKFGPIWKISWFFEHSALGTEEALMVLSDAGVLFSIMLSNHKPTQDILKLDYTILNEPSSRSPNPVFSSKSLSGLDFSLVSNEHLCYIASKEGVVAKFNIRRPVSGDGMRFLAHTGPVYAIQHSPAMPIVFLTCGADHCLNIWIDGIQEPLITLVSAMRMPMVGAEWSPSIPTIIATLTSTELAIWDIAHNTTEPANSFRLRSSDQNLTTLKFAPDGMGVVVGDHLGHVKLYQLRELPRIPFLAREALTSALVLALLPKQHLLNQFKKIQNKFKSEFITNILDSPVEH